MRKKGTLLLPFLPSSFPPLFIYKSTLLLSQLLAFSR
jgi:hypothetical protein